MLDWFTTMGLRSEAERVEAYEIYQQETMDALAVLKRGVKSEADICTLGFYLDWVILMHAPAPHSVADVVFQIIKVWETKMNIPRWITKSVGPSQVLDDLRNAFFGGFTFPHLTYPLDLAA